MDHAGLDHAHHDDAPPHDRIADLTISGVMIGTVMIIMAKDSITVPSSR